MRHINAALVALAFFAQPVWAAQTVMVTVGVDCEKPTTLLIAIKNASSARVVISESLLPWNHSKVLRMEGFQVADGRSKRLRGVAPVADYLHEISLASKQSAKGEIALNRVFADFDDANKTGDILIFYQVPDRKLSDVVGFSGASGVVLIPQKGFFSQGCPALVHPSR